MDNKLEVKKCIKQFKIKETDIYKTPEKVFREMEVEFRVNLRKAFDPCPFPSTGKDGLQIKWKSPAFVNPPFSNITKWIRKALKENEENDVVSYFVLPWWYACAEHEPKWKRIIRKSWTKQYQNSFAHPNSKNKNANVNVHYLKIDKALLKAIQKQPGF
jgi:hypothetical protein